MTVAILDAHSGAVVATNAVPGLGALPERPTVWEDDDHVLIPYSDGSSWALLRLSPTGDVNRATDVIEARPDQPPFAFSARP